MEIFHRPLTAAESKALQSSACIGTYRGVGVEYEVRETYGSHFVTAIPDGPSGLPLWMEAKGFASAREAMLWVIGQAEEEIAHELRWEE